MGRPQTGQQLRQELKCVDEHAPAVVVEYREVLLVGRFDSRQRLAHQDLAARREVQQASAAVAWVLCPRQQASRLKLAQYLARHHRIGAGVLGQAGLGGFSVTMLGEPPQRGEQHELDVRELVGGQRLTDPPLPGEGGAPEQEAWALLGRAEPRRRRGYDSRSFARATRECIVCAKSAVMAGPSSCVCSSGPSMAAA
jgi:hypothetical protein